MAGALKDSEYVSKLKAAGFEEVTIEPTRVYKVEDAEQFLRAQGIDADAVAADVEGKFMSAFIRAKKPAYYNPTFLSSPDSRETVV